MLRLYFGDNSLKQRIRELESELAIAKLETEETALVNEQLRLALLANMQAINSLLPSEVINDAKHSKR